MCHVSCADPFCNELREISLNIGKQLKYNVHDGSTYICVEGPRFSTRAESNILKTFYTATLLE